MTAALLGDLETAAETFARDGVACLRGAFDDECLRALAAGIEHRLGSARSFDASRPDFRYDGNMWEEPPFREFVSASHAAEIAGRLMRSTTARLFKDQLFVKEPGAREARTPWHHDLPYWCVDGTQVCSLWLPLDRVDDDNGAVRFVRGSHRWDRLFNPVVFETGNRERFPGAYEEMPDIEAMSGELDIVSFELEPGDCLVFHARTIHGGPGNTSPRRRRAYSTRWTGDDAVYYPRPTSSLPARDPGIEPGMPLAGELFPLLWTAQEPSRVTPARDGLRSPSPA